MYHELQKEQQEIQNLNFLDRTSLPLLPTPSSSSQCLQMFMLSVHSFNTRKVALVCITYLFFETAADPGSAETGFFDISTATYVVGNQKQW